jgi:hypothetical protein
MVLHELINVEEPAMPVVREWVSRAVRPVEILAPSPSRDEVLVQVQVTTRSPMGAVAHETGGILIDRGWLRVLGSGHPRLTRTLPGWNANRGQGFYLVADDVVGGFFAINGGALGSDVKNLYYFAPDTLRWEPLNFGYSTFLQWACSGEYDLFCQDFRWPGWEGDVAKVHGDRCLMTWPPLWTKEGHGSSAKRAEVPVEEAWGSQMDCLRSGGLRTRADLG